METQKSSFIITECMGDTMAIHASIQTLLLVAQKGMRAWIQATPLLGASVGQWKWFIHTPD